MRATKSTNRRSTATAPSTPFRTSIEIPAAARVSINELLNQQLADTTDLFTQLKHAHWNVKGSDFYQLHKFFDELAAETLEWADLIAERITILGGYANGTVRMAASASRLPEFPTQAVDGLEHVATLVERYAAYCATTRAGIESTDKLGDPSTSDLLTEVSRAADKALWFLEAHLQG